MLPLPFLASVFADGLFFDVSSSISESSVSLLLALPPPFACCPTFAACCGAGYSKKSSAPSHTDKFT